MSGDIQPGMQSEFLNAPGRMRCLVRTIGSGPDKEYRLYGTVTGSLMANGLIIPEADTVRTPYVRLPAGGAVSTHIAARSGSGVTRGPGSPSVTRTTS